MGLILASVLFLVLVAVWVTLPFAPAIDELVRKTDAEPLRVVRRSETDIRHFAHGFRDFVRARLGELLDRCGADGKPLTGYLDDGTPYLVAPDRFDGTGIAEAEGPAWRLTAAAGDLELAGETSYPLEIYCRGTLTGGPGAEVRALLAERDIDLGAGSASYRWLHAGGDLRTGPDCRLFGRVSADGSIRLGDGCRFERLHAPRIQFGNRAPIERPAAPQTLVDLKRRTNLIEYAAGRYLVRGDLEIPAGGRLEDDLVVAGRLTVGADAHIVGSVKSQGGCELGAGVRVEGALVGGEDLRLGEDCRIDGPVVAERRVAVGDGCVFGSPEHPTTVSARGICLGAGVVAHGTVWGGGV